MNDSRNTFTQARGSYRTKVASDVRLVCECGGITNPASYCTECGALVIKGAFPMPPVVLAAPGRVVCKNRVQL